MSSETYPALASLDLDAFRRNGHTLVDWIADYLCGIGQRRVLETVEPGDVHARLPARAPEHPEPFEALLANMLMLCGT